MSNTATVTGSANNLNGNDKVYLLIQPQSYANESQFDWYAFETSVNTDGTWNCNAQFGLINGDIGRKFAVCAIITNETLQNGPIGLNLPKYEKKYEITVTKQ